MFTDFSNPSVYHVELTKHGRGGYEVAIRRGDDILTRHPKLVASFKRAWDLGEKLLSEVRR